MKRSVEDFLRGFVLPLVRGGSLSIERPISEPELTIFIDELPHASVPTTLIDDARSAVCAELVVRAPDFLFDDDDLHLVAALHNLLVLSHPDLDSYTVTRGMERRVLDTAQVFARRPLSRSRRRVLARHGLLHNLFAVSRTDVTVRWWTGHATFYGQKPPKRLTSWKSVRRVIEEHEIADFAELLGSELIGPVAHALVRRSPLTMLLRPERMGAALHWEELVFLLRDAELARAVAYHALQGASPSEQVVAPACYAAAFEQMLERRPEESDVRAVAAFLVHLSALFAVAEADARDLRRSALLNDVLAPDRAGSRPKGLATFFALPAALAEVDPRLAMPPGVREDTRLRRRWEQHRAQVRHDVGDAVIETLAVRLARHLVSTGVAA